MTLARQFAGSLPYANALTRSSDAPVPDVPAGHGERASDQGASLAFGHLHTFGQLHLGALLERQIRILAV